MNRSLLIGGTLTALLVVMATISLMWTPYPPTRIDILHKLAAPSPAHVLGTDPFGRDVLSMIMAGARSSLSVALVAVTVGAGIGIPLGLLAASQSGRWVDQATMGTALVGLSLPDFWLGLVLIWVVGVKLGWLPTGGYVALGADPAGWLRSMILPAGTLFAPPLQPLCGRQAWTKITRPTVSIRADEARQEQVAPR